MSSGQTVFAGGSTTNKFEIETARHDTAKRKKDKAKRQKNSSLEEEFLAPPLKVV